MAYGYYPGYQQYPNMQQYQPPQTYSQTYTQTQNVNPGASIVWVNGYNEAFNYLVAPNCAVALWDSASPCIYLKSADQSGRTTIKTYELVERNDSEKKPETNSFASDFRKELDCVKVDIEQIKRKMEGYASSE